MGSQKWWGNGSLSCIKVRIDVLAVGIVGIIARLEVLRWKMLQTELDLYGGYIKWWKCVVFAKWLWFFPKMKWQYIQWLWMNDGSPMHILIMFFHQIASLCVFNFSTRRDDVRQDVVRRHQAQRFGGGDEVLQWRSWFLFHTCVLSWSLFVE